MFLEIQFHFGMPNLFGNGLEGKILFKTFGIPKMKLDCQNINWEFRSLGHKVQQMSCNFLANKKESNCIRVQKVVELILPRQEMCLFMSFTRCWG